MFLNASICGIIALVITVLMTIGTFVTTYRTISKKAVKKNRKKFFSVVIQTIGFFTAFLTCQSLTIPIIFKLPVIFGMHIVRTMTYGSITCQCILEAFFVILNFLPKDLSKKIVKVKHVLFIIGTIVIGAVVSTALFFTTEYVEINDSFALRPVNNLVLIPLIILSVAIALFFGFTMMFYIKSVKDMISTKVTKFMFRIILVGLLLTCTVILVLADTWMILFGEELGDLEELVHVILPIPVTLFAFIHFIRRSLTSSCRQNCLKLCPCKTVKNQVSPLIVQVHSIS